MNFKALGLKKLIATCYASSPIVYTQLSLFDNGKVVATEERKSKPYKVEITEATDKAGARLVELSDVEIL